MLRYCRYVQDREKIISYRQMIKNRGWDISVWHPELKIKYAEIKNSKHVIKINYNANLYWENLPYYFKNFTVVKYAADKIIN